MKKEMFKKLITELEEGCGEEYNHKQGWFLNYSGLCGVSGLCPSCVNKYRKIVKMYLNENEKEN